MKQDEVTRLNMITEIANNALYFRDNSDYEGALWDILRVANPDLFEDNGEGDPKKELEFIEENS